MSLFGIGRRFFRGFRRNGKSSFRRLNRFIAKRSGNSYRNYFPHGGRFNSSNYFRRSF